jgi:hypothetical protein
VGTFSGTPTKMAPIAFSLLMPNVLILKDFMVRPDRVELPTFWFVARRSIQLSYGRTRWRANSFNVPSRAALCNHPKPATSRVYSFTNSTVGVRGRRTLRSPANSTPSIFRVRASAAAGKGSGGCAADRR